LDCLPPSPLVVRFPRGRGGSRMGCIPAEPDVCPILTASRDLLPDGVCKLASTLC
jgi:hypothetical protein